MFYFIFKKILTVIPALIGITLLTFMLIHLIPGDPIDVMLGERGVSPEQRAHLAHVLGLDKPLLEQYFIYITNIFHGSLGNSFVTHTPVVEEFFSRFPATIELSICAILIATIIGIPAGILSAIYRSKFPDYTIMTISLTGFSMPLFWWAMMLIMFFSIHLGVTPVSGRIGSEFWLDDDGTGFMLIDSLMSEEKGAFISAIKHLILPSISLGTIPMAIIARMTRSSMLEVLKEEYIIVAKAKGVSTFRLIFIHALRNALIPIITVIGLQIGLLFAGAVLTETIYSWPGIGKWIIESVFRRDYPVLQGGILIISTTIIIVNLMVDIIYGIINPKIRT